MKIIGITGSSGSGKTTICNKISQYINAEILDADKIAKALSSKDSDYLLEIVRIFGKEVLFENGELNRKVLANIIYNDFKAKKELDKITFKFVCRKIEEEIKLLRQVAQIEYILIDAPLLLEAELDKICDYIISVIANKDLKISRICLRDDVTEEIANQRLNIQKSDDYYISRADFVIENNNGNNIEEKIKEICKQIKCKEA